RRKGWRKSWPIGPPTSAGWPSEASASPRKWPLPSRSTLTRLSRPTAARPKEPPHDPPIRIDPWRAARLRVAVPHGQRGDAGQPARADPPRRDPAARDPGLRRDGPAPDRERDPGRPGRDPAWRAWTGQESHREVADLA